MKRVDLSPAMLANRKAALPHGQWLIYLREQGIHPRTAQRLLKRYAAEQAERMKDGPKAGNEPQRQKDRVPGSDRFETLRNLALIADKQITEEEWQAVMKVVQPLLKRQQGEQA